MQALKNGTREDRQVVVTMSSHAGFRLVFNLRLSYPFVMSRTIPNVMYLNLILFLCDYFYVVEAARRVCGGPPTPGRPRRCGIANCSTSGLRLL